MKITKKLNNPASRSCRAITVVILLSILSLFWIRNQSLASLLQEQQARSLLLPQEKAPSALLCESTETSKNVVPSFLIVGAQKAGTTALYALLNQVPSLQGTIDSETHFFDLYRHLNFSSLGHARFCKLYSKYQQEWETNGTSTTTPLYFEKTPNYMTSDKIAHNIHHFFHQRLQQRPKIIIILRDPVQRAYSWYKMKYFYEYLRGHRPPLPPFETMVARTIHQLRHEQASWLQVPPYDPNRTEPYQANEFRILPHTTATTPTNDTLEYMNLLTRGLYSDQIRFWLDVFPAEDIKVIQYEKFNENKHGYLNDILEFVGAPPFVFSALHEDHSIANQLRSESSENLAIPPFLNHTQQFLQRFYQPANEDLANLLGEQWKDAWIYE